LPTLCHGPTIISLLNSDLEKKEGLERQREEKMEKGGEE
jgi:hypothetical protein